MIELHFVDFKDKEPPFEKIATFVDNNLEFRLCLTCQILIPQDNKTLDVDCFGNWYQALCYITSQEPILHDRKSLKLSGPILLKEQIIECWQEQFDRLVNKGKSLFEQESISITSPPKKITL